MVLLHIVSNDVKQANQIADFLVENKLVLNAVFVEQVRTRKRGDNGNLLTENQTLIIGKTKASWFNDIDKKLRDRYGDKMPELYSVPIVNMDWQQADELVNETVSI